MEPLQDVEFGHSFLTPTKAKSKGRFRDLGAIPSSPVDWASGGDGVGLYDLRVASQNICSFVDAKQRAAALSQKRRCCAKTYGEGSLRRQLQLQFQLQPSAFSDQEIKLPLFSREQLDGQLNSSPLNCQVK